MTSAITQLQIALDIARTNEPIHRTEQADKCHEEIESFQFAIAALQTMMSGANLESATFEGKLARAINCHSKESGSDTPDFILAEYLRRCLESFDLTMTARTAWYGPQPTPCDPPQEAPPAPEYRLLDNGETILEGDEWQSIGDGWVPRESVYPGEVLSLGTNGGLHAPHRRRVSA